MVNLDMDEVMYMHACKIAIDSIKKKMAEKMIPETGLSMQEINDCLWIVRYEEETQKRSLNAATSNDQNTNPAKN